MGSLGEARTGTLRRTRSCWRGGYEKVKDIGEDTVYLRQEKNSPYKTMVLRYSDNLTYTNPAPAAVSAHQEGDQDFKFGKQANWNLREIVGMEREVYEDRELGG